MDWNKYQKAAFRTNANLDSQGENLRHMMLGMATEIGELVDVFKKWMAYGKEIDWKNVKEECGDFNWYVAGYAEFTELDLDASIAKMSNSYHPKVEDVGIILDEMIVSMGKFASSYKTPLLAIEHLRRLLTAFFHFLSHYDIDYWRLLENNIEKLQTRYPEKFTTHHATQRNLGAEYEVLDE